MKTLVNVWSCTVIDHLVFMGKEAVVKPNLHSVIGLVLKLWAEMLDTVMVMVMVPRDQEKVWWSSSNLG